MAAMADNNPTVQATPWIDRWPDMIVVPPKPVFVEPAQPLMRKVLLVIAIVALCVPLFAVPFGGIKEQRKRKARDGTLHDVQGHQQGIAQGWTGRQGMAGSDGGLMRFVEQ